MAKDPKVNVGVETSVSIEGVDAAGVVLKTRALYARISELEKEHEMHTDRAKDAKKRIDAFASEIRALITAKPSPQMEIVPPAGNDLPR